MNTLFDPLLLLPIALLLAQALIFFICGVWLLRRFGFIVQPFSGADYSQIIFAASVLLGVLLIAISPVKATFQAFYTYQSGNKQIFASLISKSGQYFIVMLVCEILFGVIIWFTSKTINWAGKSLKEIREGNLPLSCIMAIIIVGASLLLQSITMEILDHLTPRALLFR